MASTLDTSDQDFKAGRRVFRGTGQSATVSNQGSITVQQGGFAALLGGRVENTGLISVPLGKVGLGAGEQATLDFSGDGFLQVAIPSRKDGSDAALIRHSGTIKATGGTVVMQAATARDTARNAINLSGLVEARSVSGRSGAVVLGGGEGGTVTVSGRVDTSARGAGPRHGGAVRTAAKPARGGDITVTGDAIRLAGATLKADGTAGGGSIRVGGGFQGQGPLQRASTTTVDAATTLSADAGKTGRGGDVVVWSDQMTRFSGRISATGGAQGGDGGQAEVSSHGVLDYAGTAVLTAAKGAFGTLLLDPYNVTISNGTDTNQSGFTATGNDSVINAGTLQAALGTANVTVSTGSSGSQAGTITLAAATPLTWSTASTLTLNAASNIALNSAVTANAGGLALVAGGTIAATDAVNVRQFALQNGAWVQNNAVLPGFSAADFRVNSTASFLRAAGGDGSAGNPYRITDVYGLQGMAYTSNGTTSLGTGTPPISARVNGFSYQLANDIDASGTSGWNAGAGFVPIGSGIWTSVNPSVVYSFTGALDGQGRSISGLTIRASTSDAGLFGYVEGGTIRNLNLANVNVGSTYNGAFFPNVSVGGLAGYVASTANNAATVSGVSVSGQVSGSNAPLATSAVGGVIGSNSGIVTNVSSSAAVSGGTVTIAPTSQTSPTPV